MTSSNSGETLFGPFRLSPATRKIERNGVPVAIGDRALDILIVLVERAGNVVSHRELISRVWRDLVVDPSNLRVHVSALRKTLGDGEGGARYIENVTGQGYSFVAPVKRADIEDLAPTGRSGAQPAASAAAANTRGPSPSPLRATQAGALPPALARMVGRDDVVRTIAADLLTDRFVTIVGPGGMGKTTVAVSVSHTMLDEFAGKVCFVDLGAITEAALLPATVGSTLGLPIQSADAMSTLMGFLSTTRMLLILDNCEHVIDAAASLAETIFSHAGDVYILATSREALRVEGEHVQWLRALESPPPDGPMNPEIALGFPAVKLFVERAIASDRRFELTDENAPIVADICRRLDGIALALEFVAGRVGTYGLEGTADLLNKSLGLHWPGRRTALPRHQTLHALLDWSYGLLARAEQRVLRKLAIFVGPFTLEAARAIASSAEVHPDGAIETLIAKSLVSAIRRHDGASRYRLLETTRLFAMGRLEESGEKDATAECHARYFIRLLESASGERQEHLGNLRASLEWCSANRDTQPAARALEIDLAAVSAPLFLDLSLWSECRRWSEVALAHLDESTRGDRRELVLQEALAISSMFTGGTQIRPALTRGLEIARQLGETQSHLRLLASLHFYSHRITDFKGSLAVSEEIEAVARTTHDATHLATADWLQGSSQYALGNQPAALQFFEKGFSHAATLDGRNALHLGIHYRSRGLNGLARVQWLCGYPDRALLTARRAITEVEGTTPANQSYALLLACHVFVWCGDLKTAQEIIERVMGQPHWQGRLVWFHTEALALKGELLVRRGMLDEGTHLLRSALGDMKTHSPKNLMRTVTACALAEGLAEAGEPEEALAVIDDVLAPAAASADTWETAELLRVKGGILLAMSPPDFVAAERYLERSIACARRQGARGWELRAAITLSELWVMLGRREDVRPMLSAVYSQFTEGFETQDLKAAARLLER